MSDSIAAYSNVSDSLAFLSQNGYMTDIIFNLHGDFDRVVFYDSTQLIEDITREFRVAEIKIRALYQTCCYGSYMIDDWENMGVQAVSGAIGLNSFAIFSPIFFLDYWTTGLNFEDAVESAYNAEINKLLSYNSMLPIIEYLISDEILNESRQSVGGTRQNCVWIDSKI